MKWREGRHQRKLSPETRRQLSWSIRYDPSLAASGSVGSQVTDLTLTSAAGGSSLPFTVGQAFRKGDVPSGQSIVTDTSGVSMRAVIKRTWADGSAKHVILVGRATLTANVAKTVSLKLGTATGTNLTSSDIQTAAPSASVQCGALGTINLSSLLSSPVRTWISTPEMVECHYRADVGSTQMSVWFHVRLYAGGALWVRAIVENGYLDNGSGSVTTGSTQTYVPTVTIGGSTIYNNSGSNLTHYLHTRYMAESWIGTASDVQPLHNVTYLRSTKLVPNYGYSGASSTALNALVQTYTPMGQGPQQANMGDTGFQPGIGLLPNWCAMYAVTGDARAYKATVAGSSSVNSYPIVFRSKSTNDIIKPSSFGTWNPSGAAGGGTDTYAAGSLTWETNHHPGEGYLAYLITGDYWHYDTCAMTAANCWLFQNYGSGSGTSRMLQRQTRGTAWQLRSVGLYCAIATDADIAVGQVAADYRTLLENNYNTHKATADANGKPVWAGSLYQYEYGRWPSDPTTGGLAPWMTDFFVATNGFLSDIEPVASMANLTFVRDWMYRFTVGRLGESGVAHDFDFTRAAQYGIIVATANSDASWYQSWADIHNATFGSYNTTATNTLQGGSGADPAAAATGYWGNLLPALCYAVDHGFPGARTAYNRLTGATNWSTAAATFNDTPVWGCAPRVSAFAPSYAVPSTVNTSTLIGSNTAQDIRPTANYSTTTFDDATFKPYGGGVFNPKFSAAGAYSFNNTGGHNDAYFPGSIIFDYASAAWSRLDNANGVPYQSSFTFYETADTNGAPYYELNSATAGQFPVAGHTYASQLFLNEGNKGSVIAVTRGAMAYESIGSATAHKLNQETGLWTRAASGAGTNTISFEGSAVYDPNTNRYYLSQTQFWNYQFVQYLRGSDWSWQQFALSDWPPSGTNYTKMFGCPQRRLLLIVDAAGNLFGLDTAAAPGTVNLVQLTTTGSWTTNSGSNTFVQHRNGKFYQKPSNTGNVLNVLTPPNDRSLGTGGTWTKSTVTIGGSGLPDRTITNEHYTCLHFNEALDRLCWISGTTQQIAVIKV